MWSCLPSEQARWKRIKFSTVDFHGNQHRPADRGGSVVTRCLIPPQKRYKLSQGGNSARKFSMGRKFSTFSSQQLAEHFFFRCTTNFMPDTWIYRCRVEFVAGDKILQIGFDVPTPTKVGRVFDLESASFPPQCRLLSASPRSLLSPDASLQSHHFINLRRRIIRFLFAMKHSDSRV